MNQNTLYVCTEIPQWNPFVQLTYTIKNGEKKIYQN
jgi:hypothetical protein